MSKTGCLDAHALDRPRLGSALWSRAPTRRALARAPDREEGQLRTAGTVGIGGVCAPHRGCFQVLSPISRVFHASLCFLKPALARGMAARHYASCSRAVVVVTLISVHLTLLTARESAAWPHTAQAEASGRCSTCQGHRRGLGL